MPELWCPDAVKLPFKNNGAGSFLNASPRGVLHTTESLHYTPSTTSYYGHRNPPHFTVTREGVAYQHYPISIAARALRHPAGTIDTNKMNAYQVEIVGRAASMPNMPAVQKAKLRQIMRWIEASAGVGRLARWPFVGSESYGEGSPYRLTPEQWVSATGWLGHQMVPGNSHWDPGRIDIRTLLTIEEEPMVWEKPGDPVNSRADAEAAAQYQGGAHQKALVAELDDAGAIAFGRTLNLLMEHDARLQKGKL